MRATRVLAWAVVLTAAAMDTYPVASAVAGHSAVPLLKSSERCNASRWTLPVDGKYNTKGEADPHKLNVHLIAHSHDDPGWLFSIDQYYMQRVQYTLDTVVEELLEDPNRQFMFVEQSFFQRWWHQQSSETKLIVKQLVKEGRLDLSVNGGWCMHDEATPHYTAMVDQTAYGHHLLREEFNITPRIGWQIDPFGHSSTQGSLLSAGVGFDALYFARIDYQDYALRKSKQDLEFIWRPSKSRGKHSQVFTGEIINHYGPPLEFDFAYRERQIQDDSELHDFNVCSQVDDFVRMAHERGASTKGNHIFIPMGGDFQYDNARRWYKNMDKLVHYVNQDNRVSVLYSNLSYYTDLKLAENLTWSVKIDDFFPYASGKYQYWSGFFTSRPALKRFARVSNTLFQQVRQLHALYQTHHAAQLDKLQRAVGLVQHHDGLSGTEKQAVADDYALRLNEGILDAEKELNEVFFVIGEKEKYEFCLLANVSTCNVSTSNEQFEVLVHNALARKSVQTISIPIVFKNVDIQVISGSAKVRQHEVFVAVPVHLDQMAAPYSLVFSTELDPLSEARFLISKKTKAEESDSPKPLSAELDIDAQEKITLENDLMRVKIAKDTGSIISITNKKKNIELPLSSRVLYYQSFQAKNNQRSGAYIFRPDSKTVHPVAGKADKVRLIDLQVDGAASGGTASRVAFQIGKWVTLEYRVNADDEFVEIEWTVGSIPIGDKKGKEVIIRFNSQKSIKSAKTLYTDSNGLEFITRVRNHRDTWNLKLHDDTEFVAANYFPITTGAYIKDDKYQLNIVTDRAQGAASLEDGQIEVMVHRRLLADDSKGVGEFLNETESFFDKLTQKETTRGLIVRGNFFINVDSATEGIRSIRTKMERQLFAPLVAFRKLSKTEVDGTKVPWLAVTDFPENVGLTTLQRLSRDCVMARLTHLYSVEEHASLSKPVKVDFSKLFTVQNATISDVSELLLTGIAPLSSQAREPYAAKWKTSELEDPEKLDYDCKASTPLNGGTEVELQAMEVRSFRVCFKKSTEKQAAEYTSGRATGNDDADMKRDFRVVTGEEADLKLTGSAPHLAEMDEIMAVQ